MIKTKIKDLIDIACIRYKKIKNSNYIKFNSLDNWLDKESLIFEKETKQQNDKKSEYLFDIQHKIWNEIINHANAICLNI